jgi:hypothetical protein
VHVTAGGTAHATAGSGERFGHCCAQPVLASQGTLDPGVTLVEKPFTESILLGTVRGVPDGPGDR